MQARKQLFGGVLLAALLMAPARAAEPVEIRFVGWGGIEEKVAVTAVVKDFEREHPGIRVKFTQIPGVGFDYFNKLRLMIVGGLAPDVFYLPDGNFGALASRDVLLNLDPYIARSKTIKLADIWPSGLDRYRWDGKRLQTGPLYCLPKDIGPYAMFYNKDVLKAHGVAFPDPKTPLTWDQALAAWKRLTFADGRVKHYGVSAYPYESAVWSNGGEIVSPDKSRWVLASDPKSLEAVQWCASLGLVHHVAPDASKTAGGSGSASPGQLFESGLAAMHFDGRWMVPRYRDAAKFDWDVAPVPVPRAGMKSVCWSGSVGYGIYNKTKAPDAAFQLVEYLAGPVGQRAMTKMGFQVPNQRWLADSDVYRQPGQKPAHPEVFLDAARTSRPGPWTDTPNTFWHDVFWVYVGKVWRGERQAAEYLPTIAPLVDNALREGNARKADR